LDPEVAPVDPIDPFVPMPMPDPPWAERVSILVSAHVVDGEPVPWSHGEDARWLDDLEQGGLVSLLEEEVTRGIGGAVVSVRSMGLHYAVVLDGRRADELLARAIPVLERVRGPLPPGSKAVLTRRDGPKAGLRVEMLDLA
jgi:hypothetical protein